MIPLIEGVHGSRRTLRNASKRRTGETAEDQEEDPCDPCGGGSKGNQVLKVTNSKPPGSEVWRQRSHNVLEQTIIETTLIRGAKDSGKVEDKQTKGFLVL